METTINIDEDVLDRVRELAGELGTSFRFVVNDALRLGLDQVAKPLETKAYRTVPHEMGLRRGYCLDNVQELLSRIEGKVPVDSRRRQYPALCRGPVEPASR